MRYFIYDCNEKIVGNPKGYRTFRGAEREYNRRGSPAYRAIWASYYAKQAEYFASGVAIPKDRFISAIRLADAA